MKVSSKERGKKAEDLAFDFLKTHKLTLIEQNYYAKGGEIDLIMFDQSQLVFIEVRYRKTEDFIYAIETIDSQKCQRIIKTAKQFLQHNKQYLDYDMRFDVLIVNGALEQAEIEWIKNAFQA